MGIVITISSIFYYLYYKDADKRKLMFSIGIFPSTISFLICAMDLQDISINHIITNLYYWAPFPLIITTFFAVNESIFKTVNFEKLFKIFIILYIITFSIGFLPFTPTMVYPTLYIIFSFEILIIGAIIFVRTRDFPTLMFMLVIICFAIAGTSMSNENVGLSIFAYFVGYIFFGLIFQISKPNLDVNRSKMGSYFSLEQKLENTELALLDTDKKYKAFFDLSLSWVFIIDFQGNVLELNDKGLKSLGLEKDDVSHLNISDLVKPEDMPRAQKSIQEIIQTGCQTKPIQYQIKAANGNPLWLEMEASLIYKNEKPYAIQGICRDITEQKLAELELKKSEEQFKKLFEYAPDAFYTYDFEGNFIDGNREAEKMIGYKKEDLIGKNMLEVGLVPEDQIELVIDTIEQNLKGEPTGPNELTLLNRNGDEIYVETSAIPLKVGNKDLVLGIAHDITKRKLAEQEINNWKDRYEAAVNASGHLLYDWNTSTNEVKYGGNIEEILGYSTKDMVGGLTRWVERIHPEDRDIFQNTIKKMVENAVTKEFEYRVQKSDGEYIIVQDTGQFITDGSGNITSMIGFIKDVTRRKKAAEAIKKKSANLERFAKLAVGREKKMIELKSRLKELER
jgi:PAS domain S-box-containing protein